MNDTIHSIIRHPAKGWLLKTSQRYHTNDIFPAAEVLFVFPFKTEVRLMLLRKPVKHFLRAQVSLHWHFRSLVRQAFQPVVVLCLAGRKACLTYFYNSIWSQPGDCRLPLRYFKNFPVKFLIKTGFPDWWHCPLFSRRPAPSFLPFFHNQPPVRSLFGHILACFTIPYILSAAWKKRMTGLMDGWMDVAENTTR